MSCMRLPVGQAYRMSSQDCPSLKRRYLTREGAQMHRDMLARHEHPIRAAQLDSYLCEHCGGYHVGHSAYRGGVKHRPRRGKHRRQKPAAVDP